MERIVLRAEYSTDDIFNDGFICICKDGKSETIEGVFGNDYIELEFVDYKTLHMILHEKVIVRVRHLHLSVPIKTAYECTDLYIPEISCPDEYYLENEYSSLSLRILSKENSPEKIDKIFKSLEAIRS